MNKTLAYLGVVAIVIVGLAGAAVLAAMGIDTASFIALFSTTLPIVITAGVSFYGLERIKEQNEKISKNVNGNTSTLLSLIQRDALTPDEAQAVAVIENDARELVAKRGEHVA